MEKLLHAQDLARYAGVHKSTVLLAIRRGELRASRTVGKSARITFADACEYLRLRDCPIPEELLAGQALRTLGILTESVDALVWVQSAVPAGVELRGSANLYESLILAGAFAPGALIVDLDLAFMNPIGLLRTLRASEALHRPRVAAVGIRDDLFSAARGAGADRTFRKVQRDPLHAWITEALADAPVSRSTGT